MVVIVSSYSCNTVFIVSIYDICDCVCVCDDGYPDLEEVKLNIFCISAGIETVTLYILRG